MSIPDLQTLIEFFWVALKSDMFVFYSQNGTPMYPSVKQPGGLFRVDNMI